MEKQIGKKIVRRSVEKAVQKGIIQMHVNTIYEDVAKFYRKHGFKDSGIMLVLRFIMTNKPRLLNCPEGGFPSH